jgi:DHA1 family multidrug resistance protein-like MFS transporter
MPTAMAYIGESTEQKEKSKGMGQLGAMVGLGVILGPLMGGLLSTDSLSLPFFIGSGLAFLAFLLVIFLLPESKPASASTGERIPSNEPTATPPPDSAKPPRTVDIYLRVLLGPAGILLLLIFIMSFGMTNFQGMIGLYAVDKFAFDTKQVGAIWMVMGVVLIIGQGGLVGRRHRICAGRAGCGLHHHPARAGIIHPGPRPDRPCIELVHVQLCR